jgi:hypothetical protein
MRAVYGLYRTPEAAHTAFDNLRDAGISPARITVISSEPLENYEFGEQEQSSALPWIAALGALVGFFFAYLLTWWTQQDWPIKTGGMAIVTSMTNTIILFEVTMLGAVLATVIAFLTTAGIPRRLPPLYDPEVSQGKILIGVHQVDTSSRDMMHRLLQGSADTVRQIEFKE